MKQMLEQVQDAKPAESSYTLEQLITNMSKLLNVSCKTASSKALEIELENGSVRPERPQLHVFIHAPFGQFKSTIFKEVAKCYDAVILTDCTFPKLVGSYDVQQRTLVPSACWTYRNKTMIFDEFYFYKGIINSLLQLLEGGVYRRAVARSLLRETVEVDEDLHFRASTDGEISIKTRFNAIIGTMHDVFKIPDIRYDALISQCVPVYYEPSTDEAKEIVEGKSLFSKIELPEEPLKHVEWKDIEYLMGLLDQANVPSTLYARTLGDLCRIYSVLGLHDAGLYQFVVRNKMHLPYIREYSDKRHGCA